MDLIIFIEELTKLIHPRALEVYHDVQRKTICME